MQFKSPVICGTFAMLFICQCRDLRQTKLQAKPGSWRPHSQLSQSSWGKEKDLGDVMAL